VHNHYDQHFQSEMFELGFPRGIRARRVSPGEVIFMDGEEQIDMDPLTRTKKVNDLWEEELDNG